MVTVTNVTQSFFVKQDKVDVIVKELRNVKNKYRNFKNRSRSHFVSLNNNDNFTNE
jgi:hypothetical protein